MNNTQYDPKVLQKFADGLYSQANSVVGILTILGLVVGGVVGFFMGAAIGAVVGAIVLGALGLAVGLSIAFQFKLRAQVILCQKQIEENTRKTMIVSNESARVTPTSKQAGQTGAAQKYFFSVGEKILGLIHWKKCVSCEEAKNYLTRLLFFVMETRIGILQLCFQK